MKTPASRRSRSLIFTPGLPRLRRFAVAAREPAVQLDGMGIGDIASLPLVKRCRLSAGSHDRAGA